MECTVIISTLSQQPTIVAASTGSAVITLQQSAGATITNTSGVTAIVSGVSGSVSLVSVAAGACAQLQYIGAAVVMTNSVTPPVSISETNTPCASLVIAGNTLTVTAINFASVVLNGNPCSSPPTVANAGPDQTIDASGTAQLAANTPTVGIGVWSVSGASTNLAQFSNIYDPAAIFDPDVVGNYVLTWTISNAPYPDSSDTLNLLVQVSSFVISGKIIWEGDRLTTMSGVANVVVTLSGTESGTYTTGSDGLYTFTVAGVGDYNISCAKNSVANALNGVTTTDASRVTQHIIGALPLTDPYKLVAADVNGSNSVSASDASIIQQAAIGNPAAKAAFALKTWIMIPQDYVFPNNLQPWGYSTTIALNNVSTTQTNKNFIALKLGDVNSTANPAI